MNGFPEIIRYLIDFIRDLDIVGHYQDIIAVRMFKKSTLCNGILLRLKETTVHFINFLLGANQFAVAINKDGKDLGPSYSVSNVVGLCKCFKWLSGSVLGGYCYFSNGSKLRILDLPNGKKQK